MWLDRVLSTFAPQWALRRERARVRSRLIHRHFEAASVGRRTQGWRHTSGDANAAGSSASLQRLRDAARDLVRNNPNARSGLRTIVSNTIGTGIRATDETEAWLAWSDSTACDADGRNTLAGLQRLAMRTVVEGGEVIIRRRGRRSEDGLPIPLQLQVLEGDYLDTAKDQSLPNGGRIIQGVELDPLGRRVAYWLFREHPGSSVSTSRSLTASVRVPASDVVHVFSPERAGGQRGVSWFAPVILRSKDLDEFEDATLMKQKVAALLAVISTDASGGADPLGTESGDDDEIDTLEPGGIHNLPAGRQIDIVSPPSVRDYADYTAVSLRAIAAGLGVAYEDMTGDYTDLPFSAARMSRLRHWSDVEDWRWNMIIPQMLEPVRAWARAAAALVDVELPEEVEWTAPGLPMIEPDKEGLAMMRNVRAGVSTLSEEVRSRGFTIDRFLDEYAADLEKLDARGIVLDVDARRVSQQGQRQADVDFPDSVDSTEEGAGAVPRAVGQ